MSINDFELTSEDSGSSTGQTNDNLWFKDKIREVTAEGNLKIPTDEVWGYWQVLNSRDYFERLFLDIDQSEKITSETVSNHYEEIKRYLDEWKARESTGISFAQTHGGYSATELTGKLNEAYTDLKGKHSREEYLNAYLNNKKNEALKSLDPLIKGVLADKVLTSEELNLVYQEGINLGLSKRDIELHLEEAISRTGGIKDDASFTDKDENSVLKTSERSDNTTGSAKDKKRDGRKSAVDLALSGLIEEYLEKGGKLTEEAWVEFYKKISAKFSFESISELKKLAENIISIEGNSAVRAINNSKTVIQATMVSIKGGTFLMGILEHGSTKMVQNVTLSDFLIANYEVTQGLWKSVMGNNPSRFTDDDNLPVEQVSWYDAVEFCNKLSEKEGLQKVYSGSGDNLKMDINAIGYRLPTEAEWEYAARGGSLRKGYNYSGSNNARDVAWYDDNSNNKTQPAGKKTPNELGLYDMSGNVWEWCWDWYGSYSSESKTNPTGPHLGTYRVYRGGGWFNYIGYLRPGYRLGGVPTGRSSGLGFRIVRSK
ncbi:MAG: SUMF1/EgtB/PvdO family nonheme iron enzyme [Ignavibacteriaceae bacterium]|nr:SUMF1/EgtB/PvdO family nonheme iron enzyme [Ignavibacteriaceae bacterium]